jgi:hypothetical protein
VVGTALPAFTDYSATLNFVNPVTPPPASDVDAAANTGNLEIERWNGSAWSATTVGTRSSTSTAASGIGNALGDLADAEKAPIIVAPDSFNAFETSTGSTAITGQLYTKVVSSGFKFDVVAVLSGARHSGFDAQDVTVDLVTGATTTACGGTPVPVSSSQTVTLATGRATVPANFSTATAYRDVRVRISWPTTTPTVTSCSADRFTIRPAAFTVTSTNATNTDTGAGATFKTGATFNLRATADTGYDGTPVYDNVTPNMVVGSPNAGTLAGTFGAASSGVADGSFTYSEVGNFGLAANAILDSSFASSSNDTSNGDCNVGGFSNIPDGANKVGCSIGSSAVAQTTGSSGFGRFIPDNFGVAFTTPPVFGTTCGTFSYVGQTFTYPSSAVMTVTARNSTNGTTANYAGAYVKLTNATLSQAPYDVQSGRYVRFDALGGGTTPALALSGLPLTSADPGISFTAGVGTLTFSAGTGTFSFTRPTAAPLPAPFDADIALKLNIVDSDNVAFAGNPASFGAATSGNGISFSGGKAMRYGRLRMQNAAGSPLVPLIVQVESQYWNGTSFITNFADSCTPVAPANIIMSGYTAPLTDQPTCSTGASATGTLSAGRMSLVLSAPKVAGSVTLTPNLSSTPSGNTCLTAGSARAVAGAANLPHLQGNWSGASFNQNPTARATFGVYRGSEEVIHFREVLP